MTRLWTEVRVAVIMHDKSELTAIEGVSAGKSALTSTEEVSALTSTEEASVMTAGGGLTFGFLVAAMVC